MTREDRAPPTSFDDFDQRLRKLRGQVDGKDEASAGGGFQGRGLSQGLSAGIEVVAGLIGGAVIGYGLDWLFGTAPLFFIVFFLLGSAAGILNAYRTLMRASREVESGREERAEDGRAD